MQHLYSSWEFEVRPFIHGKKMKQAFLQKYQDYCSDKDIREEIFKMSQQENESLEGYVERLQYNLQISRHNKLDSET